MRMTNTPESYMNTMNNPYANSLAKQTENVFYKFMCYLGFWVMASSIILGKYHLSDHSDAAIHYTLVALMLVTVISFSAVFWTLCANWLMVATAYSHRR